ncbi:MAG: hypothetical protein JWM31_528 [Solirubrobacterales bacterium]|nr:hypothetical protein [Solirubrobacterales bacterium]
MHALSLLAGFRATFLTEGRLRKVSVRRQQLSLTRSKAVLRTRCELCAFTGRDSFAVAHAFVDGTIFAASLCQAHLDMHATLPGAHDVDRHRPPRLTA